MVQHLSVRVPWHDNGWNGTVCTRPEGNQACRALGNIAEKKQDSIETACSGQKAAPIENYQPPCLMEGGAFMSGTTQPVLPIKHPYKKNPGFKHIRDTNFELEPYSFIGRPYWWTLRENARWCMGQDESNDGLYFTQYDDDIEPETYSKRWVSNGINQRAIFDYFYKNVIPDESIVVAYTKTLPFIENPGRIVVGVGHIISLGEMREYGYEHAPTDDEYSAYLWERPIGHSIRENKENGFIFPFAQIQSYLKDHPEQDPEEFVVFAPDEYFAEFSYATEQLSHDALIYVLNKAVGVFQKYKHVNLPADAATNWDTCIKWCKRKLKEVWLDRGVYPGLGAVLCATGVPYGFDIAEIIRANTSDTELWEKIPYILENIKEYLPDTKKDIAKAFTKSKCKTWVKGYYKDQNTIMEMLSRMNLSIDQASLLLDYENLGSIQNIEYLLDMELEDLSEKSLDNPYLLYEKTRSLPVAYCFGIETIDLAMFPDTIVREACSPPESYNIEDADDERRLRAILTALLEKEAQLGSTLSLSEKLVEMANGFRSDVPLELGINIKSKTLKVHEDFFVDEFVPIQIHSDSLSKNYTAYQLNRFVRNDEIIRNFFTQRLGKTIDLNDSWETLLNAALDGQVESDKAYEHSARKEKVKAIERMATSRVSVLTGGAGTGKTTTLVGLCLNKTIQDEGIVVLAPTGKARVVLSQKLMEKNIPHEACTLFQYLQKSFHCDFDTMSYYLSGKCDIKKHGTVIIDECSMLTEEMLGALAEAAAFAQRVIFVGDPNQLPPIGAGKPFFEMVSHLRRCYPAHFAHLAISNRQKSNGSTDRIDVEFAKLFTADQQKEVCDSIFGSISNDSENIEFVKFEDENSMQMELFKTISRIAAMASEIDIVKFDMSLGGELNGEWMNFNNPKGVENWQVLSPYRNNPEFGTASINRYIQKKYRIENHGVSSVKKMSTPYPLGNDTIVYGEKVINIRNHKRKGYPSEGCINYVANGEVGIVERIWRKPKDKRNTHQVKFSSQPSFCYNWDSVITDADSDLELAYALTIHKAQGSGFKATIFIINEPEKGINSFLSRELVYTALTRHSDKVFILYNKEPWELKKYSDSQYSDLARRLTNLFISPQVLQDKKTWYDENLIHLTASGEWVRSKSEVIIANELKHSEILYEYEKSITLADGLDYLPDFTILGKKSGPIYWEHLGMMNDINYRKRWETKKHNYAKHGISEEIGNLIITYDDSRGGIDSSGNGDIARAISHLNSIS